ncbi:MAG: VOC family protein [Dehalococcoidia bacterium]|nr:VOC family protein [Dehalococcoidia bacterium]
MAIERGAEREAERGTGPGAEIGLIDMLQTAADDVAEVVRFYSEVLGATVESAHDEWSQVRLGGISLGIHQRPASVERWMPSFRVSDISAVKAALEAAGAPVLRDFHDIPGGVVMAFQDPAGNPLQAVQLGITEAELGDRSP